MFSTTTSQGMGRLSPPPQRENSSHPKMPGGADRVAASQPADPFIDMEVIIDQVQARRPELDEALETVRQVERLAERYENAERARLAIEAENFDLTFRLAESDKALREAASKIDYLQFQLCLMQKNVTMAQNNCAIATALLQNQNALQIGLAAPSIRIVKRADRLPPSLPAPAQFYGSSSGVGGGSSHPGTQHLSMPDATQHGDSKRARHLT